MKKSIIEDWKNGESVESPAGNLLANEELGRVNGGVGDGWVKTISGGEGEIGFETVSCNPSDWW